MNGRVDALGLFSGGLDSLLAAEVLARQGVNVRAVYLRTGFGRPAYEASVDRIVRAGRLDLAVHDVSERYLREVVLGPVHGVGAGQNPCRDCRIFMLREADRLARRENIGILFTGEVIGQRALDQSRAVLEHAESRAGVGGRLLRPLCAALMPATEVEREGKIERKGALRIHGSARRAQLELARRFGIVKFPTPSGGCCRLADRRFARRLRDHLAHHDPEAVRPADLVLLPRGRHFRLDWRLKVVLGRNRAESEWLHEHAGARATCQVASGRGSFVVVEGDPTEPQIPAVAALAARYSAESGLKRVDVILIWRGERRRVTTAPASPEQLERWRI